MKTQTEIKAALAAGEHTVVFTKTNGDERTMLCTLKSSLIPAAKPLQEGEVKRTKKPNFTKFKHINGAAGVGIYSVSPEDKTTAEFNLI